MYTQIHKPPSSWYKGEGGGGGGAILATILDFIKNQKSGLNRKKW